MLSVRLEFVDESGKVVHRGEVWPDDRSRDAYWYTDEDGDVFYDVRSFCCGKDGPRIQTETPADANDQD